MNHHKFEESCMNNEDVSKTQDEKIKNHPDTQKKLDDLKEELELKTTILDTIADSILVHDLNGNLVYVNETACNYFGYTKKELMKLNLHDLDIDNFSKIIEPRIKEIIEKKELKFQSTHLKKNKTTVPLEIHAKFIEFQEEKLIFSIARDITKLKNTEENLRWNINLIRSMAENSPLAFYVVDNKTDSILYFNHNFCRMWELEDIEKEMKTGEIKNKDIILRILPLIEDKELFVESCAPLQNEKNRSVLEDEILLLDGRIIRRFSKQIRDPEDKYFGRLFICENITERKRIENTIKDREEHLSLVTDNMLDLIYQVNSEGIFEYVSPSIKELLGYEARKIIGKRDFELISMIHPDDFETVINALQLAIKTLEPKRVQHRYRHADGHYIWVETIGNPLSDNKGEFLGAVYITRDITELKKVENRLKSSLEEKEVLLREIHHRVKNNMQIISSLLNLQSRHVNDEKIVNVLKESRNRVKSMAMVHEELYRSSDLSKIDFSEYIQRLLSGLFSSYGFNQNYIKPEIDVENILLDINTAVPCGLIINELVSNSLKHAFWNKPKGKISIKFHLNYDKHVLIVADDGTGFPEDIDFKNTKTLGLQLVNTLVRQLSGDINIYRDNGTLFKIVF